MTLKKRFQNWFLNIPPFIRNLLPCEVVYVRIGSKELHLRGLDSHREWRDYPALAATKTLPRRDVVAVGKEAVDAVSLDSENLELMEPFKHPRSIIGDFDAAFELLKRALTVLHKRRFYSPVLVLHPLEKLEGGLTKVEQRALVETAEGTGARRACVWVGRQLTDEELRAARHCRTERLTL